MAETKFIRRNDAVKIKKIDAKPMLEKEDTSYINTEEVLGFRDAETPNYTTLQEAKKTRTQTKITYEEDILDFTMENAKGLSASLPVSNAGESLVGVPKSGITCVSSSLEFDTPNCKQAENKINPIVYQYRGI